MNSRSFLRQNASALLLVVVTAAVLVAGAVLRVGQGLNGILERSSTPAVVQLLRPSVSLGMFDPDQQFSKSPLITIDHFYLNWTEYQPTGLEGPFRDSRSHNRTPLITIEPHAYAGYPDLLNDVARGSYDWKILQICTDVAAYERPVLLRWGPKMETERPNAAWAGQDPFAYKKAYQHFVSTCRSVADNTFYVWSPAGGAALADYWPGSLFTDYVGLSVFADPQRDRDVSGSETSFSQLFRREYDRVAAFGLPVIIAEIGVAGDSSGQQAWMANALRDVQSFPLVKAVIYYNTLDTPENWDPQYPVPDWRITYAALFPAIAPDASVQFEPKESN